MDRSPVGAQEAYLREFHAGARAGITARAFARGDCGDGRSSYEWLVDAVADAGAVLDLGCGDGYLVERLRARGRARAIGLDVSAGELVAARRRLGGAVPLIQARAQAIPLRAGAVDAVISHLAFMLMPELETIAAEVARVLAPGGRFAAIVGGGPPAEPEAFTRFLALLDREPRWYTDPPRLGELRARTREGWAALFPAPTFAPVEHTRLAVDLSGTAAEVWSALGTMYGVAELRPGPRAELEAAAHAAWRELAVGERVPCTMVVWRAVVQRA